MVPRGGRPKSRSPWHGERRIEKVLSEGATGAGATPASDRQAPRRTIEEVKAAASGAMKRSSAMRLDISVSGGCAGRPTHLSHTAPRRDEGRSSVTTTFDCDARGVRFAVCARPSPASQRPVLSLKRCGQGSRRGDASSARIRIPAPIERALAAGAAWRATARGTRPLITRYDAIG